MSSLSDDMIMRCNGRVCEFVGDSRANSAGTSDNAGTRH